MNTHVLCGRVAVLLLAFSVGACEADDSQPSGKRQFGFNYSEEATATDTGLPAYSGSKPYKEDNQSSTAANIGINSPIFGVKVIAVNLETADQPERVAAFYREALAKYGDVLDCSHAESNGKKSSNVQRDELRCESDDPGRHAMLYKVGTKQNQRIVAIKAHGSGTRFNLVHVNISSD